MKLKAGQTEAIDILRGILEPNYLRFLIQLFFIPIAYLSNEYYEIPFQNFVKSFGKRSVVS